MLKQMVIALVLCSAAMAAAAGGFDGVFEGLDKGMMSVSGRSYPLAPDATAEYEGRRVAVDMIPAGTPIRFELGKFNGVSSVTGLEITQASDELDEMFPPH